MLEFIKLKSKVDSGVLAPPSPGQQLPAFIASRSYLGPLCDYHFKTILPTTCVHTVRYGQKPHTVSSKPGNVAEYWLLGHFSVSSSETQGPFRLWSPTCLTVPWLKYNENNKPCHTLSQNRLGRSRSSEKTHLNVPDK